jgi:hypothetical protein
VRFTVQGRFVVGALKDRAQIVSSAGAVVDHCSASLSFLATR